MKLSGEKTLSQRSEFLPEYKQENPIPAPDEDGGRLSPAEEDAQIEHAILGLLLSSDLPGLWTTEEVADEVGDPLAMINALSRLDRAGPIHRCEGFEFPTRAAARFDELSL